METAVRCIQDYDRLYEVKYVKGENIEKGPLDHRHTKYELVFVLNGNGEHTVNGKKHLISAGDVFIVSPADIHHYFDYDDEEFRAVRINFSNAFYFYYMNPNCRFDEFPISAKLSEKDFEKSKKIASLLIREYAEQDSMVKNELCRDLIEQLLILVSRNCCQAEEKGGDKLKAALDYIQNNFYNPIKINDIARAVSYAPNYLSSQFSKYLGLSIREYLQDVRLYYARELIMFSEYSVGEICYKSGFKSIAYFSKAFKMKFGESPNSCRGE